jgi:hypothetical protein
VAGEGPHGGDDPVGDLLDREVPGVEGHRGQALLAEELAVAAGLGDAVGVGDQDITRVQRDAPGRP